MPLPKVSVCIPAYNEPDYFRRALRSVTIQEFEDYEIIITDDSPGACIEDVVKEFLPNSKIKYVKNACRKGSPENWNEAVRHASGEYIKLLHHDDWLTGNNSLGEYVKMLDCHSEADFAFSATYACDMNQKVKYLHSLSEKQITRLRRNPTSLFMGNLIGSPSTTIYRNNKNKVFDTCLKWVVDIDFYVRQLAANANFIYSLKPLVSTTTGASHQVTNECTDNRDVELFEWVYLYNKITFPFLYGIKAYIFICRLLGKYKVKSLDELMALGKGGNMPTALKVFIKTQKTLRRL